MEIIRSPEYIKQVRIAELKKEIDGLKKEIQDVSHLLDDNLVSGGARRALEPSLADKKDKVKGKLTELAELVGNEEDAERSNIA